jgi:hypothetical protein
MDGLYSAGSEVYPSRLPKAYEPAPALTTAKG